MTDLIGTSVFCEYFEKPPLQTWMTAPPFSLFGIGEWQARLWTGLRGIFDACRGQIGSAIDLARQRVITRLRGDPVSTRERGVAQAFAEGYRINLELYT